MNMAALCSMALFHITCCCMRLGSCCGKLRLVCALVWDKHIRLLFTLS